MTLESRLVTQFAPHILAAGPVAPALDLACGDGRNGLFLARRGQPVVFADRRPEKLAVIAQELGATADHQVWSVDLEAASGNPLAGRSFSSILVFRYLHRPLLPAIRQAITTGGLVVYETFTLDHARFGRPTNPDFLLQPGELQAAFSDWEVLHTFEGVCRSETGGREQAIAQLVARKPP